MDTSQSPPSFSTAAPTLLLDRFGAMLQVRWSQRRGEVDPSPEEMRAAFAADPHISQVRRRTWERRAAFLSVLALSGHQPLAAAARRAHTTPAGRDAAAGQADIPPADESLDKARTQGGKGKSKAKDKGASEIYNRWRGVFSAAVHFNLSIETRSSSHPLTRPSHGRIRHPSRLVSKIAANRTLGVSSTDPTLETLEALQVIANASSIGVESRVERGRVFRWALTDAT